MTLTSVGSHSFYWQLPPATVSQSVYQSDYTYPLIVATVSINWSGISCQILSIYWQLPPATVRQSVSCWLHQSTALIYTGVSCWLHQSTVSVSAAGSTSQLTQINSSILFRCQLLAPPVSRHKTVFKCKPSSRLIIHWKANTKAKQMPQI